MKITEGIKRNESVVWAITIKGSEKLIGSILLWNIVKEQDTAEIGYELIPAYQGKGLMQEALQKVIEYGFDIMKLKTIRAFFDPANERSKRILERNGFKLEKQLEEENEVVYSLSKTNSTSI
jgi:ribosomal-protein-alanine N-acetyltransferase